MMSDSQKNTARKNISRKYMLSICAAAALISLFILLLSCFAAFTCAGADNNMSAAQKNAAYCDNYYQAETTATEIICDFSQRDGSISSKNGRYDYDADQGKVEVTCIDGNVFFTVPINKNQGLYVDVQVTKNSVEVNSWNIV